LIITDNTQFNQIYMASLPPKVVALMNMPIGDLRTAQALALSRSGLLIDNPIMVWGWDPFKVMMLRQSYGLTWVPSGAQPPLGAPNGVALPGVAPQPGQIPYDPANPPANSIKVSLDSNDYPPFTAPVVVPTPPAITSPVGIDEGGGIFAPTLMAYMLWDQGLIANGQVYPGDPRGPFVFNAAPNVFAMQHEAIWFTPAPVAPALGSGVVNAKAF
jgi:hypothetical protein